MSFGKVYHWSTAKTSFWSQFLYAEFVLTGLNSPTVLGLTLWFTHLVWRLVHQTNLGRDSLVRILVILKANAKSLVSLRLLNWFSKTLFDWLQSLRGMRSENSSDVVMCCVYAFNVVLMGRLTKHYSTNTTTNSTNAFCAVQIPICVVCV